MEKEYSKMSKTDLIKLIEVRDKASLVLVDLDAHERVKNRNQEITIESLEGDLENARTEARRETRRLRDISITIEAALAMRFPKILTKHEPPSKTERECWDSDEELCLLMHLRLLSAGKLSRNMADMATEIFRP